MVSAQKNAQAVNVNCAAEGNMTGSMSSKGRHSTAAKEQFLMAYHPRALAKYHSFVLLFNLLVITKHNYFTSGGTFMR